MPQGMGALKDCRGPATWRVFATFPKMASSASRRCGDSTTFGLSLESRHGALAQEDAFTGRETRATAGIVAGMPVWSPISHLRRVTFAGFLGTALWARDSHGDVHHPALNHCPKR